MLFYAALTVAGVIAAAVIVWVFRSMAEAGKVAYRSISPAGRRAETRLAHLNRNLGTAPTPWGWSANRQVAGAGAPSKSRDWNGFEGYALKGPSRDRRTGPATSASGRSVLQGYDFDRKPTRPDTSSWPYRDSLNMEDNRNDGRTAATEQKSFAEEPDTPHKPWGW